MKWVKVSKRKPEYATPVPYRELMESVEGVNRYWYGQFEIFGSQFSIDGELNYEPHYLDKIEWLDEQPSTDKDKEIADQSEVISEAILNSVDSAAKILYYKKEIERLKALTNAQAEYIDFLDDESEPFIQFASVHGMYISNEVANKGKLHREKIKQLNL